MLFLAACTSAVAFIVKPALDDIFFKKDLSMLKLIPLALILLFLIKGFFDYYQSYFMAYVGQKVITDIRDELYHHIQNQSLSYFSRNPTGVLMSRILNDVGLVQRTVSDVITTVVKDIFTILGLTGVIFYRDWKLAIVTFLICPWAIIPISRFGQKSRKVTTKGQIKLGYLTAFLHETIAGNRIVKAFRMEEYENRRFSEENRRLFKLGMKRVKIKSISAPVVEFLGGFAAAAVIWYGGYSVIKGYSTPGTFFSFVAAFMMLYEPIKRMNKTNQTIQEGMAAAARVFEVLDSKPEIQDKPGAITLSTPGESIKFSHVSFKYEDDMVLKDVNLEVKIGEIIAIVGMSGAGKSTVANLLPRFYDVTEGAILIDGHDIRDITVSSLRAQFGIVTQQTILFNDTARNNIAYGSLDRSDKEIIQAARAAYASEFIENLPSGYDTIIGEQGFKLSGGERQRIAIARALLKNAPILILDEATSSLDAKSEEEVQKALENLMEKRTTFIIAHRLSTIRKAQRIIVLSQGRIVEEGTHEELMKLNGEYRRLYDIQMQDRDTASLDLWPEAGTVQ
jgi:subfamily B ATP-binding cassette protein MsbA